MIARMLLVAAILVLGACTNLNLKDRGHSYEHNARTHQLHEEPAEVDKEPVGEGRSVERALDRHRKGPERVDERRLLIDLGR